MARILGTGNVTLDIVHTLEAYPRENTEVRCRARELRRGGNTANLLAVLAQYGHACSLAGMLTGDADGERVRADLRGAGVDTAPCRVHAGGTMPVSSVLLSAAGGSRTIVHFRDLPEFSADDFAALDLSPYDWLHFEGRNPEQLRGMLERARDVCPATPRSLEVEKPRPGIESLFGHVDVLMFSRDYAEHGAGTDAESLLERVHARWPAATAFCTRGGEGALAVDAHGEIVSRPAVAPGPVVDTLGAGDTFNAAVIDGCLAGRSLPDVLGQACALAGRKCTRPGFAGLVAP